VRGQSSQLLAACQRHRGVGAAAIATATIARGDGQRLKVNKAGSLEVYWITGTTTFKSEGVSLSRLQYGGWRPAPSLPPRSAVQP
jgi:hypothetical protein